jgi:hypothetical protein
VNDDAWTDARESVAQARADCLVAIANHYCHPVQASSPEVLQAVAVAIRAGFDLGVAYTHHKSTIPSPPPPSDAHADAHAEAITEELLRGLRGRG